MANELDVVLKALQKERDEIHGRLMQIDRIISKVKDGEFGQRREPEQLTIDGGAEVIEHTVTPNSNHLITGYIPKGVELKIQVLMLFDIIGRISSLNDLNTTYTKLTGNKYNLRESIRSLQAADRVKLIRQTGKDRGHYWARTEWIQDGKLLDHYKFVGFDLLYDTANLRFD